MIAALAMYDRPELAQANDALWSAIRAEIGFGPDHLDRITDPWEVWQDPDMILSQTCGMPYRTKLHQTVQLVGTPDYGVTDCAPGFYRSVFVARKCDSNVIKEFQNRIFTYNDPISQSGWAAAQNHAATLGFTFRNLLISGAHRQSALAVADGRADIAAVDAVTWRLIQKFDGFATNLRVIDTTEPTPGLPLITALRFDPMALRAAFDTAIQALAPEHAEALGIKSIVTIPPKTYLDVPIPAAP